MCHLLRFRPLLDNGLKRVLKERQEVMCDVCVFTGRVKMHHASQSWYNVVHNNLRQIQNELNG